MPAVPGALLDESLPARVSGAVPHCLEEAKLCDREHAVAPAGIIVAWLSESWRGTASVFSIWFHIRVLNPALVPGMLRLEADWRQTARR